MDILKLVPLKILANVITINNTIFTIILGLPLTLALYGRVKQWGIFYGDVIKESNENHLMSGIGVLLMIVGSIGGVVAVNLGIGNPQFTVFPVLMVTALFFL